MPKTTDPGDAQNVATEGDPLADHPDEEAVRSRAYEISQRDDAGSPEENWQRAIEELQAERGGGASR